MRQSWETTTSVSAGHIILPPTRPVGGGRPQRESNPGPPHQESRALPQSYRERNREKQREIERAREKERERARERKRERERERERDRQTDRQTDRELYTVLQKRKRKEGLKRVITTVKARKCEE